MDSATTSRMMSLRDAPSARRTPISRVFCVTDTSVVFVITTMAARSAIAEMGTAAAPTRSEIRRTKSRAASGLSRSKLSATPGRSCRFARSAARATFSAGSICDAVLARAKMFRVGGAPKPFEGGQRHPDEPIERGAA